MHGNATARCHRYCAPFLCVAISLAAFPADAQQGAPTVQNAISRDLARHIRSGRGLDEVRRDLLRVFKETDIDGGGVSQADYEGRRRIDAAKRRARVIGRFITRDLDGDGAVDRAELRLYHGRQSRKPLRSGGMTIFPTEDQIEQTLATLVREDLKADGNGDGTVTTAEMSAWAESRTKPLTRRDTRAVPLTMDRDGDGAVSESEFLQTVDAVLKASDTDGDGKISSSERTAIFRQATRGEPRSRQTAQRGDAGSCAFPPPARNAKVVLLSTHGGEALSSASLGGDDTKVTVSDVWIEKGEQPLYVILSSYDAMIWRFDGSLGRIDRVVAGAYRSAKGGVPHVGITGLPADRVHIAPKYRCLGYYAKPDSPRVKRLVESIPRLLGRGADAVLGRVRVSTVSLPAGKFEQTALYGDAVEILQSAASAPLWKEVTRRYPGGVVRIDPKKVVSRSTVAPYSVLPQHAGLAQLVDAGALRVIGTKRLAMGKRGVPYDAPAKFLVLKKIRYPAAVTRFMEFVIAPGVEQPDGSPGRAKVVRRDATE